MLIEAGRFYRTRDGRKVGPMERPPSGHDGYKWRGSSDLNATIWYRGEDGSMGNNGGDIVAAWPRDSLEQIEAEMQSEIAAEKRGPVRTVTRKEIVAGEYGVVAVEQFSWTDGSRQPWVQLRLVDPNHRYHAAELRAAAATLTKIADALDEAAP